MARREWPIACNKFSSAGLGLEGLEFEKGRMKDVTSYLALNMRRITGGFVEVVIFCAFCVFFNLVFLWGFTPCLMRGGARPLPRCMWDGSPLPAVHVGTCGVIFLIIFFDWVSVERLAFACGV